MNPTLVTAREGSSPAVVIRKVKEAELDEMWSFVSSKKHPRWLWEALDTLNDTYGAFVIDFSVVYGGLDSDTLSTLVSRQ